MKNLIRKIHMYMGLLSFSVLLVYGIAGLTATFQRAPDQRRHPDPEIRYETFKAPQGASDREVADLVYRQVSPPYAGPVPTWALRRDESNNLRLDFYSVNGVRRVAVLEKENRLRIEHQRSDIWHYLNGLHTTTPAWPPQHLPVLLWALYNELAIFTLLGMAASGMYLWAASRPKFRAAQVSLAAGAGVFVVLYILTR
jgi:uncharacterized iron-regulated membrane protein